MGICNIKPIKKTDDLRKIYPKRLMSKLRKLMSKTDELILEIHTKHNIRVRLLFNSNELTKQRED
jgi:hypothetical protein